jgi:hypothetical protein
MLVGPTADQTSGRGENCFACFAEGPNHPRLILLSVFLTLGTFFASEMTSGLPSLLRRTLEYGFEIIGWVTLWHPIDLLIFEPFLLKDKMAVLRKLTQLRVEVRSWE